MGACCLGARCPAPACPSPPPLLQTAEPAGGPLPLACPPACVLAGLLMEGKGGAMLLWAMRAQCWLAMAEGLNSACMITVH